MLTGRHEFRNGRRISIDPQYDDGTWGGGDSEVPSEGFDILIGNGVFVASGAIIIGKCEIGDNSIVMAGAVVTKNFSNFSMIAGIPAKKVGDTRKAQL